MQLEFLTSYPTVMTVSLTPRFFDVTTSDDFPKSSTRLYRRVKNRPPNTLAWFAREWYGSTLAGSIPVRPHPPRTAGPSNLSLKRLNPEP